MRTLLRAALCAAACWGAHAWAASLDVTVVDAAGAPLADAVVFATGARTAAAPAAAGQQIVQRQKAFHPFVTAVQTGTAVAFPNEDAVRHHVYSFSPAKVFELKLYVGTPRDPVLFDKPGVVVLGCNIHDQMLAYVLVVDTPHFARTDASGRALLDNLADQHYAVAVWHPGLADAAALPPPKAEVRASGAKALRVVLDVKARAPARAAPHGGAH